MKAQSVSRVNTANLLDFSAPVPTRHKTGDTSFLTHPTVTLENTTNSNIWLN